MSASLRPVGGKPAELLELLEPWVHFGGEPLLVHTSGSTGEPKTVVLSHAAMVASATRSLNRLGGRGRWMLALPVSGVGGLQVLVRSILSGTRPLVAADHPDLAGALRAFADAVTAGERSYTSLVPTQVHRLADDGLLPLLAPFDAVLVGGAAISPDLRHRAEDAGAKLIRTYGMTETCGGCVYDGLPLDDVRVRIGHDGQVHLAGPTLFDGYLGMHRTDDWFATADFGTLADGVLSVAGRLDDVAVSGGVNVPMPAVEQVLRSANLVRDVSVVGVDDAEWGTRVVAVVAADGEVELSALRDAVTAAGLPRTWAPLQVVHVQDIPLLPNGKVDRARLRGLALG